ncbi:unnamed protein product [Adineta steineri]|uniref:Glycosyl transferase family 1 domain-containing protein n=1 Tax=Adineta steineri TaxID=433720 RepID=A0A820A3A8_9BILA|nr:unnamed protein product [Adineta steineri]
MEFTKNLVSSLETLKDFNSSCYLHTFTFQKYNQSFGFNLSEPFVRYINDNKFTSIIMVQDFEVSSSMWQLAHLGCKLSLNIKIYYILHSSLAIPSLEVIGLVRYMSNHGTYLIVLTWFDYHSLIHTCGVEEKKILHIPYGISIPKSSNDSKSNEILSKYKDTDFVLLSIISNHPNENYKRLILNLKSIISKIPNFYLLIIVQESLTINSNLSQAVKNVQLEDKVTWTDKSMSTNELDALYKRANAYISLLDKTILTFVILLNAMSYGLPIISTPNIYSDEILNNDKGLIVSFDDDTVITESIIAFLTNQTRMKMFSKNGYESVKNWTWDNIAKQYLLLFNNSLKHTLTDDPYITEMYWNNTGAMNFDGQNVFLSLAKGKANPGIYTIYSDSFLQLNGKLNNKYEIEFIGLKTLNQYIILHRHQGIDQFNFKKENFTCLIQIDYIKQRIFFASKNINLEILRSNNEIKMYFSKINKFTNAFGLIGSTIGFRKENTSTSKWFIPGSDIFSHSCEGQRLSILGVEHNVFILPENTLQCSEEKSRKIHLIMEGRFFDITGFTAVNRKMFLSLITYKNLLISIKPVDRLLQQHETAFETLLVYSFFLRQDAYTKKYQKSISKSKTIIFRHAWPPNLKDVSEEEILVHQQPWEFHALPIDWLRYFQDIPDELWVPSEYVKSSFIANGIDKNKIHVFPHGVFIEKFNLTLLPFPLNTKKTFKFLSIGGVLPRKGYDILLHAYNARFSSKDDVTLIIHSHYGHSVDTVLNEIKKNPLAPEVISLRGDMTDMDMIRLFKSADAYVAPYRSEGFGLSTLQAMAAGLPPIVTKYGPSLDFCPDECAYFIDAKVTECFTSPCGKMKVAGTDTIIQAMWAEPNNQSLSQNMYRAYTDRIELRNKSQICRKHAQYYTWDKIADKIFKRLSQITH